MSSSSRKWSAHRQLDELIHRIGYRLTYSREAFVQLIQVVRSKTRLLAVCPRQGRNEPHQFLRIVRACARMATEAVHWQKTPENWQPVCANLSLQFRFLVSHLFERYEVPHFMARIWLDDRLDREEHFWWFDLYLHLAHGKGIRGFRLPIPGSLSKANAAFFVQAPDDLNPVAAIQWSWLRSLGCDAALARLLVRETVLGEPSDHQEFWESAVRFVVNQQPVSVEETLEIIRFLDEQKYQPAEIVWGRGAGPQPIQPDFTLLGRTLMSLRRHMTNWRRDHLARFNSTRRTLLPPAWKALPIRPFGYHDGENHWTIEELLTPRELQIEGGILQHCVASYARACAERRSSIWSMKIDDGQSRKRVLTIEVDPNSNTIIQAKGKRNSPPSRRAAEILRCWTEREDLILP